MVRWPATYRSRRRWSVARGAREMLMILCTCCPAARRPLRSPLGILLRSFWIALETKYGCDLQRHRRQGVAVRVVEPRLDIEVGLLDFGHADALMDAAYEQTLAAFEKSGDEARSAAWLQAETTPWRVS